MHQNQNLEWTLIHRKNKNKRTSETKSPLYLSDATRTPCGHARWPKYLNPRSNEETNKQTNVPTKIQTLNGL